MELKLEQWWKESSKKVKFDKKSLIIMHMWKSCTIYILINTTIKNALKLIIQFYIYYYKK